MQQAIIWTSVDLLLLFTARDTIQYYEFENLQLLP